MSYSVAQIQAQNERFRQALANKEISQAQYNEAMAIQKSNMQAALYPQSSGSPMPSEPNVFVPTQTGGWVRNDYVVSKVEETSVGTAYTLTPKVPSQQPQAPQSLSERMLDVQTPPLLPSLGIANPQTIFKSPLGSKPAPVRPLAPLAGIVASGESLVYFVPNILGVQGVPQAPPTLTGGLVGKGVQGAASLVGYNATNNELETVMLNERYGGAYAVGTVFGDILTSIAIGKAVGYGVKTYRTVAPKINTFADRAASKIGYKIYDKGYDIIEPAYQKFARVSSALDAVDTKISKTYQATKFKVSEPVISAGLKVKNEVSTFVSRASDVTLGGVKRVSPEVGNFAKGVVAPNIRQPQKIIKPTLELASEKYLAPSIGKAKGAIKTVTVGTSKVWEKSVVKEAVMFEKNIGIPNAKAALTKYASPLTSKRIIPKSGPKQFALVGNQLLEIKPLSSVKNPLKIKSLNLPKIPVVSQEAKAVSKIVAGKTRYKLNLKTPKDVLLKSERTPLKFDIPVKQVTVQTEKAMLQPTKFKVSNMVSGMPKAGVSAYPGTQQKQRGMEEELVYLTYPKTSLALDKPQVIFHTPILGIEQNKRVSESAIQVARLSPQSFLKEQEITKPNTSVLLSPRTTPTFKQRQDMVPRQITQLKPSQMPKLIQPQMPKMKLPMVPSISVGGGFDFSGSKGNPYGKWFQKRHKIKTYSQMLNTFGVGKAGKPLRKVEKTLSKPLNRLDKKANKLLTKTFKPRRTKRK